MAEVCMQTESGGKGGRRSFTGCINHGVNNIIRRK